MNVSLSDTQRTVLAIVHDSPAPSVASGRIKSSLNLATALTQLTKLGIISNVDYPELTEVGIRVAEEEGVIESDNITEYGQQLLTKISEDVPTSKATYALIKMLSDL